MRLEEAKMERRNDADRRAGKVLEGLFLLLTAIYLIYEVNQATTLNLPFPKGFEMGLLGVMAAVALLRMPFMRFRYVQTWAGLAIFGVYLAVYLTDRYTFLAYLAVLTVGLARIDYRKILWTFSLAVGGMLIVTVGAALTGAITNYVYVRDGLRSSWGVCYPTDFSAIQLFLALTLWAVWKRLPRWGALLLALATTLLAVLVTQSRNGMICGAVFVLAVGYDALEAWEPRWLRRFVNGLMTVALPLFAVITFVLIYLYAIQSPLGLRANEWMSGRLQLSLRGIQTHGITPFGVPFRQVGLGFSTLDKADYRFIDSSYVLILLRYGFFTLFMLALTWGWTLRKALKSGNRRLALAMVIIALHSITEHHFLNVDFNIIAVMPLAMFPAPKRDEAPLRAIPRRSLAWGIVTVLLLLAGWVLLPEILTGLRTAFGAKGWRGGQANAVPVAFVLLGVTAAILCTAWALYAIIGDLTVGRRLRWMAIAALIVGVGMSVVIYDWSNGTVNVAAKTDAAMVEADAPAMRTILAAAKGPVFVDELPSLYMQRFAGVRPTALSGEDLARYRGGTAVLRADREYSVFFQRGFQYTRISNAHAVYTDDAAVAAALAEAGFGVTDYYSADIVIDLAAQAEANKLSLGDSGVLVGGTIGNLRKGTHEPLYAGRYQARFTLSLPKGASDKNGRVCVLRVRSASGKTVLAEREVTRDQFDESGRLVATLDFSCGSEKVDFLVIAKKSRKLWVEDIRCARAVE